MINWKLYSCIIACSFSRMRSFNNSSMWCNYSAASSGWGKYKNWEFSKDKIKLHDQFKKVEYFNFQVKNKFTGYFSFE